MTKKRIFRKGDYSVVSIRVSSGLYDAIWALAKEADEITISEYVRQILKEHVKEKHNGRTISPKSPNLASLFQRHDMDDRSVAVQRPSGMLHFRRPVPSDEDKRDIENSLRTIRIGIEGNRNK